MCRLVSVAPLLFLLQPALAIDCRCACMAGQPVTLCADAGAAREAGELCPVEFRCPALTGADGSRERDARRATLAPPVEDAVNCRSESVWNAVAQRYELRNVCNLRSSTVPSLE